MDPFKPRDLARKIVENHGNADSALVYTYVFETCERQGVDPHSVKNITELFAQTAQLVARAEIETVIVFHDEDPLNVRLDTCPYDCDGCHDPEICPCGNCRRMFDEETDDE